MGWCGAVTAIFLSGLILCFAGFLHAPLFSTYSCAKSLRWVQLFLSGNMLLGLSIAINKEASKHHKNQTSR